METGSAPLGAPDSFARLPVGNPGCGLGTSRSPVLGAAPGQGTAEAGLALALAEAQSDGAWLTAKIPARLSSRPFLPHVCASLCSRQRRRSCVRPRSPALQESRPHGQGLCCLGPGARRGTRLDPAQPAGLPGRRTRAEAGQCSSGRLRCALQRRDLPPGAAAARSGRAAQPRGVRGPRRSSAAPALGAYGRGRCVRGGDNLLGPRSSSPRSSSCRPGEQTTGPGACVPAALADAAPGFSLPRRRRLPVSPSPVPAGPVVLPARAPAPRLRPSAFPARSRAWLLGSPRTRAGGWRRCGAGPRTPGQRGSSPGARQVGARGGAGLAGGGGRRGLPAGRYGPGTRFNPPCLPH